MGEILQFLQTYGLWIALGGALVLLLSQRGGMGCGNASAQQGGTRTECTTSAGCNQPQEQKPADGRSERLATIAELESRLAELQAQQEDLAREITRLEMEPGEASLAENKPAESPATGRPEVAGHDRS